jgi:hypothetical protein
MPKITLKGLLKQIERIPSEWLNAVGQEVIDIIPKVIKKLEGEAVTKELIGDLLREEKYALDVFRLFLDLSQDTMANELNALGIKGEFPSIRNKCLRKEEEIAEGLIKIGLIDAIRFHQSQEWGLEDILLERYKQLRGRAIRGQKRGQELESDIEKILKELQSEIGLTYDIDQNFISQQGKKAKADFAIPSRMHPQIVIEAKGYEATGSKLTDLLGDILKILQAKDKSTYFFFVTDGIGWFRRLSDLRKVVKHYQDGDIDMIYTRKTLPNLKKIREIMR